MQNIVFELKSLEKKTYRKIFAKVLDAINLFELCECPCQ